MSGTEVSKFAIISAFAVILVSVAIPKSAQPSLDMEVPEPVFECMPSASIARRTGAQGFTI